MKRTISLSQPLALTLLLAASSAALAQTGPYSVGASQSFTRDDNVNRVADGNAKTADTISTTSIFAGVNQPFGRQRLFGNASLSANRYATRKTQNNNGYTLSTGVDWSTIERLSGTLSVSLARQTADVAVQDTSVSPAQTRIVSNAQTTRQWGGTVRYGLTPDLALVGGYQHQNLAYATTTANNSNMNAVNGGVRWGSGNRLTLGAGLRITRTEQAKYTPTAGNNVRRRDIDFDATFVPTGLSTINSRLSLTRSTNSLATAADISGLTGNVGWTYRPSGKLGFNTSLSRDLGTSSTLTATSNGSSLVEANRLNTTFQLSSTYEFSPKLGFNAGVSRVAGEMSNGMGNDTSNTLSLGANFSPTRTIGLDCKWAHQTREAGASFTSSYNTLGCAARFTLQ